MGPHVNWEAGLSHDLKLFSRGDQIALRVPIVGQSLSECFFFLISIFLPLKSFRPFCFFFYSDALIYFDGYIIFLTSCLYHFFLLFCFNMFVIFFSNMHVKLWLVSFISYAIAIFSCTPKSNLLVNPY